MTRVLITLLYLSMSDHDREFDERAIEPPGDPGRHGAPVVVFDKVSLAFDEKVILRDVSFTLIKGHTKIILGASGAGKSTILKLITGLLRARRRRDLGQRRARRPDERARADARSAPTSAWCSRRARCSTR